MSIKIASMKKYCVICKRTWGSYMSKCCTNNSLVAVRKGLLNKTTKYYDLNGTLLSESDLLKLEDREESLKKQGIRKNKTKTDKTEKEFLSEVIDHEIPDTCRPISIQPNKELRKALYWMAVILSILLAILSIGYSAFVWYIAAHCGPTTNEWPAMETRALGGFLMLVFGFPGGLVQIIVALASSIYYLKYRVKYRDPKSESRSWYEPPSSHVPMIILIILFNVGWVLTLLALVKVCINGAI